MSDIIPIKQAVALGYLIYWNENNAWFSHTTGGRSYVSGPFKTIEDAAYAAISDYENIQALNREQETWDDQVSRD